MILPTLPGSHKLRIPEQGNKSTNLPEASHVARHVARYSSICSCSVGVVVE
jgi:hypothetical protein